MGLAQIGSRNEIPCQDSWPSNLAEIRLPAEFDWSLKMSSVDQSKEENVVSIFSKKENDKKALTGTSSDIDKVIEEVSQKNKETAERMKKERMKANRAVLRAYRIKS